MVMESKQPSLNRVLVARVEGALEAALARATAPGAPPRLAAALREAVLAGGSRVRPQLCLLTAVACGDARPALAESAACALELLHCASLVHDDLPCFDDAATRRGRPSLHRAFGQPLAVLAGDALIVAAFETLARAAVDAPVRSGQLAAALVRAAGASRGIVAGQAWESERAPDLDEYHRSKTGALFEAATTMGALAGGGDPSDWRPLGELLGRAYQAADDLRDASGGAQGKPAGRDAALGRPNLVSALGVDGARARLSDLLDQALAAIPPVASRPLVRGWVERLAERLTESEEIPMRIEARRVP
jgi:geranylgeranyl diphosphate synthase type II